MIDVHCTSLTSQGLQHRVFYLDGHSSRYQPLFPFGDSCTSIIIAISLILLEDVSILILHISSLLHESFRLKRLILILQLNAWLAITKYLKIVDQDWNL